MLSYSELRDARAAFFVDDMLPAEYELVYLARATTPGIFLRPAARVEAMYRPERFASSPVDSVEIR